MAQRAFVVLVLVAMMWAHTSAQTPNCTPTILSLAPCLGFLTGSSSMPSSSCCTQLASIARTQAQCLCTVLNGAPQLPFVVNQTQALILLGACKILIRCKASTPATGSPQGALAPASSTTTPSAVTAPSSTPSTPSVPSNGSPTSPSVPNTPSGSGSKTVPATGESSSASTKFAP